MSTEAHRRVTWRIVGAMCARDAASWGWAVLCLGLAALVLRAHPVGAQPNCGGTAEVYASWNRTGQP